MIKGTAGEDAKNVMATYPPLVYPARCHHNFEPWLIWITVIKTFTTFFQLISKEAFEIRLKSCQLFDLNYVQMIFAVCHPNPLYLGMGYSLSLSQRKCRMVSTSCCWGHWVLESVCSTCNRGNLMCTFWPSVNRKFFWEWILLLAVYFLFSGTACESVFT